MDLLQVHLAGKGCCRRAVRYRHLTVEEIESIELSVADDLGKDVKMGVYWRQCELECLELSIQSFTEPVAPEDLAKAKWQKKGPMFGTQMRQIVEAKDLDLLRGIFRREHKASEADLDAILEKKVAVVED